MLNYFEFSLKDIVVFGENNLQLLTQTYNPNIDDIYYDNSYSGHGFSIENVGRDNLYYTIFYSYDDTGNSEWYIQLSGLLGRDTDVKLYSPILGGQASLAIG